MEKYYEVGFKPNNVRGGAELYIQELAGLSKDELDKLVLNEIQIVENGSIYKLFLVNVRANTIEGAFEKFRELWVVRDIKK